MIAMLPTWKSMLQPRIRTKFKLETRRGSRHGTRQGQTSTLAKRPTLWAAPTGQSLQCVLNLIGYEIRGAIWYQGESKGRSGDYGHLFNDRDLAGALGAGIFLFTGCSWRFIR